MPRVRRMVIKGEPGVYHVISRTALKGLPYKDVDKDMLLSIIKRFSALFFVEVLGFSLMGNHFHLVVRMLPEDFFTVDELIQRLQNHYGEDIDVAEGRISYYKDKLSKLANYMKEIKQAFSVYYNRKYRRKGTLWGERFKSVIVENGDTLINCLAYVELNPIRAGLVKKPEDYRWNSLGYHAQTGNPDQFLSMDFGVASFANVDAEECLRLYRQFVYEAGAIDHPAKPNAKKIRKRVLRKARKQNFKPTRTERFLMRTRYFTDSGIIGSKAFVSDTFLQFQDLFQNPGKRTPKPVQGVEGVYSMKRLSEII